MRYKINSQLLNEIKMVRFKQEVAGILLTINYLYKYINI